MHDHVYTRLKLLYSFIVAEKTIIIIAVHGLLEL